MCEDCANAIFFHKAVNRIHLFVFIGFEVILGAGLIITALYLEFPRFHSWVDSVYEHVLTPPPQTPAPAQLAAAQQTAQPAAASALSTAAAQQPQVSAELQKQGVQAKSNQKQVQQMEQIHHVHQRKVKSSRMSRTPAKRMRSAASSRKPAKKRQTTVLHGDC
jgi:hypothetical protein